mmetsp:Transcript_3568/g.12794  ORF Transcript_3568/g.12794 Transcript_3568/m.12794 type:complete len:175 (+) Transcript_3568:95-619(+)
MTDATLRKGLEDQITRLLTQLQDLEELREDLEEEEYEETKGETLQQLEEFQRSLEKMVKGDMTLVDSLGAMRSATRAAISGAFRTTEVIKMFALKQPEQLRERLAVVERDLKLGKVAETKATQEKVEILAALQKLGDALTAEESAWVQQHLTQDIRALEAAGDGDVSVEKLSAA